MFRKVNWKEYANKIINITAVVLLILFGVFYAFFGISLGLIANLIGLIPLIFVAICYGMRAGAVTGFSMSLFVTIVRIVNHDPEVDIIRSVLVAVLAGIGGGTYGLLSDQRKALQESETLLEEKVARKTTELSNLVETLENEVARRRETEIEINELNQKLGQEIDERIHIAEELKQLNEDLENRVRERTNQFEELVDLRAGREGRMAELKKVIKELRHQIEEAGIKPIADDPLNEPFDFD